MVLKIIVLQIFNFPIPTKVMQVLFLIYFLLVFSFILNARELITT